MLLAQNVNQVSDVQISQPMRRTQGDGDSSAHKNMELRRQYGCTLCSAEYSIQERMLHHGTLSRGDCWSWQIFGTSIGGWDIRVNANALTVSRCHWISFSSSFFLSCKCFATDFLIHFFFVSFFLSEYVTADCWLARLPVLYWLLILSTLSVLLAIDHGRPIRPHPVSYPVSNIDFPKFLFAMCICAYAIVV